MMFKQRNMLRHSAQVQTIIPQILHMLIIFPTRQMDQRTPWNFSTNRPLSQKHLPLITRSRRWILGAEIIDNGM